MDARAGGAAAALLVLASVALLNLGILHSARRNLEEHRWGLFAAQADAKRDEVLELLDRFVQQARFVAEQDAVAGHAGRAADLAIGPAELGLLQAELRRAERAFGFEAIHLFDADGRWLASGTGEPAADEHQLHALAANTSRVRRAQMGDVQFPEGRPLLIYAVPLGAPAPGAWPAVLVFEADLERLAGPALANWRGLGAPVSAYLVARDGDQVAILTPPPLGLGVAAGSHVDGGPDWLRPATRAASGLATQAEAVGADGRRRWTVTRGLPGHGWGLVAEVDPRVMLAPLQGTLFGLLAFDLSIVLLVLAGIWLWRRQYARGLAERERQITQRHAGRMRAIVDTAFDAILTFDRHGRLDIVNRAAEQLFGRPAAELRGQMLHRFLEWHAAGDLVAYRLPEPGVVARGTATRGDGTLVPVEFTLGRSGEEGDDDRLYTAIVRDISERVETERRLQTVAEGLESSNRQLEEANVQLEEASRLKTEFLANTSHELRTPLNGIIGFVQLVLDGLCDSRDEEREYLGQALVCSRHLLGLINDVLDIAKIEAGKMTFEIAEVDVGGLLGEVWTVTHVQAQQKGLELRIEVPEGPPLKARGDAGKIKQVLINLVGNSLKFTPKGGITLRASAPGDGGHVLFEVVDTGIGIDPSRQRAVFEKFIQGDGSTTRRYGGTGLGLAISRSLVEMMGGVIGVQSDGDGRGTRMYFTLPVGRAEPELEELVDDQPDRIEGPQGGPLVLLVEDDPHFRRFLAAQLHLSGYRTVEARHAEGGWVLARRLRPAVVVLDYALACPEGAMLRTGWDLAVRMTEDPRTRTLPVIFVTGFKEELEDRLRHATFVRPPEHMQKPVEGRALVARIEQVTGRPEGQTVRVLMADDDTAVTAFVQRVLPEPRYHVDVASDGDQCLHILRTQPHGYDVLLLDLMMPGVSGYDVLREMAVTGVGAEVPVLVLTNHAEPRDEEEARLLREGLVLEVLHKGAVQDNPRSLAHVIDWHLQVEAEARSGPARTIRRVVPEPAGEPEAKAA